MPLDGIITLIQRFEHKHLANTVILYHQESYVGCGYFSGLVEVVVSYNLEKLDNLLWCLWLSICTCPLCLITQAITSYVQLGASLETEDIESCPSPLA